MTPISNFLDRVTGHTVFPIVCGVLALGFQWAVTAVQGPLISLLGTPYDYSQLAVQLAAGNGYVDCLHRPIAWYPPGYAAFVATFKVFGLTLADSVRAVGAISAAVMAGSTAVLLRNLVRSSELIIAGLLLIILNPVFVRWHSEMTADSLHASAAIAFVALFTLFVGTRARKYLVWAAIAAAIAGLVRFIGVTAVLTGGLFLLLPSNLNPMQRRFTDIVMFGVIATLPLGLFSVYNRVISGTVGGGPLVLSSPLEHLQAGAEEISRLAIEYFLSRRARPHQRGLAAIS